MDEIEKAHPDTFNTLLQIMEDGRLTDSKGRTVDFKNTILIMTSNVGSDLLRRSDIGFTGKGKSQEDTKSDFDHKIMSILKDSFKPEFLNRIDEIVIFSNLTKTEIKDIVRNMLSNVQQRLNESKINILVSEAVIDYFVEKGYNEEYGARPLRRLIQRELENELSTKMIKGEIREGTIISIDLKNEKLEFKVKQKAVVKSQG